MIQTIASILIAASRLYSPSFEFPGNMPNMNKAHIQVLDAVKLSKECTDSMNKSDVSHELIYITALAEGLEQLIPGRNELGRIDGFKYLGLNTFSSDAPEIRKQGYIPEEYREGDRYTRIVRVDEKNDQVHSAEFKSIEDALVAVAGELAWRSDKAKEDAGNLGIRLSERANAFWTSVYYLSGNNCGYNMMELYHRRGLMANEEYLNKCMTSSYDDLYRDAKRRLDRFEQAKVSRLFKLHKFSLFS